MPPKVRTHCLRGHARTSKNVDSSGTCYTCKHDYQRRYRNTPRGRQVKLASEKLFRERHREKRRLESRIYNLRKYGITEMDYQRLLQAQDHVCAICGSLGQTTRYHPLAIDHNHKTGKIRALLCTSCNGTVVRLVENNPDLLVKAKEYLRRHNESKT